MRIVKRAPKTLNKHYFKKPVIVFGIGVLMQRLLQRYQLFDYVAWICDNNTQKWDTKITFLDANDQLREYDIVSPKSLREQIAAYPQKYDILICSNYANEIITQLHELEIPDTVTCFQVTCFAHKRYAIYNQLKTENIVKKELAYKILYLPERYKVNRFNQKSCSKNGWIDSTENFQQFIIKHWNEIKAEEVTLYGLRNSQSYLYGAIDALFSYAKLPRRQMVLFPEMEHGKGGLLASRRPSVSYIFMGSDLNRETRFYSPGAPIFNVGPYIHYAKSVLTDAEILYRKNKQGRTLLFFLGHSIEDNQELFCEKELMHQIAVLKEKGSFQSVMICVYWVDFHTSFINSLRLAGYHLVSAGMRSDPYFLPRLKSLILLADAVASNVVGTYIPYCTYLRKPFVLVPYDGKSTKSSQESQVQSLYEQILRSVDIDFKQAYMVNHFKITQTQIAVCEKHHGLSQIKKPIEISAIATVSRMIWEKCNYLPQNYNKATQEVLYFLSTKSDEKNKFLYNVLTHALQ